MKFDMGAAWAEALRLVSANRQVLLIVAGVFFFLPYVVFMLVFSNEMTAIEASQGTNPDPQVMGNAMMDFYGQVWWLVALMAVVQGIGMLGLLALLTDRSRPTVGQALGIGSRLLLPYLGAQIVISFVLGFILLVPFMVGAATSIGAGVLVGLVAIIAILVIFVRLSLVSPVIAIERLTNPLAALGRSWRLTAGHTWRLVAFFVILLVALAVIGGVATMIVGLPFALMGAEAALIGQAIVSGAVNAVFVTLFLAILAAIHRQLSGTASGAVSATSE